MIQPLAKRILISPITPEKKSSVIIVKDEAPLTFKVISIGGDVTKVKPDDIIFIATFSTSELKYAGESFLLVNEDNVIAKVLK
jgi:co-chaperonin GroES (HSP10)